MAGRSVKRRRQKEALGQIPKLLRDARGVEVVAQNRAKADAALLAMR